MPDRPHDTPPCDGANNGTARKIAEAALAPLAHRGFNNKLRYEDAVLDLTLAIDRYVYRRQSEAIARAHLEYREIIRALRGLCDPVTRSVSDVLLARIETSASDLVELVEEQRRREGNHG